MAGLAIQARNLAVIFPPGSTTDKEFCSCEFYCEYEELVFASSSADSFKKDYTSFLTRKLALSDTVTIKLYKQGLEVATISDNSYGTYYSTFASQPLYVGFIADWTLIYNAFGGGQYYIQITSVLAGSTQIYNSRKFRLYEYDPNLANGTVKIESYQNGNLLSSVFDYTDLIAGGWYQSVRVPGKVYNKTPTLEVDNYLNTKYEQIQNRTKVSFTHLLQLRNIAQSVFNLIAENYILANNLQLTGYDSFDDVLIRKVDVMASNFVNVTHLPNGRGNYELEFSLKKDDYIKRNF